MSKLNKILYAAAFVTWSIPQVVGSYHSGAFYDPDRQFSNYAINNPKMGWQAQSLDTSDQQHEILSNLGKQYPDQFLGILPSSASRQDPIRLYQQQNKAQGNFDSAIIQSTIKTDQRQGLRESQLVSLFKNSTIGLVDLRILPSDSYSSDVQQKIADLGSQNPNVLQLRLIGDPQFNSIYGTDILNGFQHYFQRLNDVNGISSVISTVPVSANDIIIPDVIIAYLNPWNISPLPDPLVIPLSKLNP